METFKNIIRTYRQKFTNVASEISKVSFQSFIDFISNFNIFNFQLIFRSKYWLDVINSKMKN